MVIKRTNRNRLTLQIPHAIFSMMHWDSTRWSNEINLFLLEEVSRIGGGNFFLRSTVIPNVLLTVLPLNARD